MVFLWACIATPEGRGGGGGLGVGGWGASFRWRLDDGWEEGAEEDWAGGPWWGQVTWGRGCWWWGVVLYMWWQEKGGKRWEQGSKGEDWELCRWGCDNDNPGLLPECQTWMNNISKISRRCLDSSGVPGLFQPTWWIFLLRFFLRRFCRDIQMQTCHFLWEELYTILKEEYTLHI